MVIENQYIQTSLMVASTLFKEKRGGGLFINQRWTLALCYNDDGMNETAFTGKKIRDRGLSAWPLCHMSK